MGSRFSFILVFIFPFLSFNSSSISDSVHEHRYILQLKNEKAAILKSNLAKHLKLKEQDILSKVIFPSLSVYSLKLTSSAVPEEIEKYLAGNELIITYHKDRKAELRTTIPNDIGFSEQWNLNLIGAPEAWDKTKGGMTKDGHEIVVAIIDNGYDIEHEDLIENIWVNEGEVPNNGIDDDSNGYIDDYQGVNTKESNGNIPSRTHGTGVAGIIGARGNNELGISGINWNIKMMLITGQAFVSDIIESYNYALTQRKLFNETDGKEGALVVATNFSSGIDEAYAEDYPLWCSVYDKLGEAGILNFAASPNKSVNIDEVGDMPATCPSEFLVVVNNINRNEDLANDSGFGEQFIDIAAPGDEAFSLTIQNSYNEFSGTSSSTPHVAGAVALMYSVDRSSLSRQLLSDPRGTALSVKEVLLSSAKKLDGLLGSNATGARLDLSNAIVEMEKVYTSDVASTLNISPNPIAINSTLTLQFLIDELNTQNIDIFDSSGRRIYHEEVTLSNFDPVNIEIPINANFQSGIYFLQVTGAEAKTSRSFIVY